MSYKNIATHVIVAVAVGALSYGVFLYFDNSRLSGELAECQLESVNHLTERIDAQAEVELLKGSELK